MAGYSRLGFRENPVLSGTELFFAYENNVSQDIGALQGSELYDVPFWRKLGKTFPFSMTSTLWESLVRSTISAGLIGSGKTSELRLYSIISMISLKVQIFSMLSISHANRRPWIPEILPKVIVAKTKKKPQICVPWAFKTRLLIGFNSNDNRGAIRLEWLMRKYPFWVWR